MSLPFFPSYCRHVRFAQASRGFCQCVEHGLKIEGRAADDLEHVGGRGLLLQGLAQVACARLHLVKQPHVLDRDHSLVGEGGEQLDLLVGKRPHGAPRQRQCTNGNAFAQQRHTKHGAPASQPLFLRLTVLGVCQDIRDVNHAALEGNTPDERVSSEC